MSFGGLPTGRTPPIRPCACASAEPWQHLHLNPKSSDPKTTAEAIVLATHRYQDPDSVAEASTMIGEAMPGLEIETLDVRMEQRGW